MNGSVSQPVIAALPAPQVSLVHRFRSEVVSAGATFGEAIASKPTVLRVMPAAQVKQFFLADPQFAFDITSSISQDLAFRGVRCRAASLLLALYQARVEAEDEPSLVIHQEAIADLIGAHRVSVTTMIGRRDRM